MNDVNENNDSKKAVEAINSSTNASAKAIEAEGQCEINVYTVVSDPALKALKVSNANTNTNGRALLVSAGKSEFQDDVIISSNKKLKIIDADQNNAALYEKTVAEILMSACTSRGD